MSCKKSISILGVTGSVGQCAQDIILSAPDRFDVRVVTAGRNAEKLAVAAKRLRAKKAVIADEAQEGTLGDLLAGTGIEVYAGMEAVIESAGEEVDLVLAAIVGIAGMRPIFKALSRGINVAVANKEPLVAAGPLVMAAARKSGAQILPVDSEHNAIFQVFEERNRAQIDRIILTASGGPFLNLSAEEMAAATPEQAVAHPNWSMGRKISVDSASMMNKALEIIEAHYLFDMPPEKIEVLVHPQSAIHSMVSYTDGSILAQMGASDMRTPVAYALAWPERMESCGEKLDLAKMRSLTFQAPDFEKFPALGYAYKCLEKGQAACVILNAANEVAVAEFLERKIRFSDITGCIGHALARYEENMPVSALKTVEDIEELDNTVRAMTQAYIAEISGPARDGKLLEGKR